MNMVQAGAKVRSASLLLMVVALCLLVDQRPAGAQAAQSTPTTSQPGPKQRRIARMVVEGLPEGAKVNPSMFSGITLTRAQGDSIAKLAAMFAVENAAREARLPAHTVLDSAARAQLLPVFERQRLAYRTVLTAEQQVQYDRNTLMILQLWLRPRPMPTPSSPATSRP